MQFKIKNYTTIYNVIALNIPKPAQTALNLIINFAKLKRFNTQRN